MPHRTLLATTLLLAAAVLAAPAAVARPPAAYRYAPGGVVEGVRVVDGNADGRRDLVVLVRHETDAEPARQELLWLPSPARPAKGTFFAEDEIVRIPLEAPPLGEAGAVCVGRFGPGGEVRLRFLSRAGVHDVTPQGVPVPPTPRHRTATLLGRSPGRPIVFWDAVADLDGDGTDECWFPRGDGPGAMHVLWGGERGEDLTLEIWAANHGASEAGHLVKRIAYVPNLVSADLDGDGRRELVAFRSEGLLLGWTLGGEGGGAPRPPSFRLELPFVRYDLAPDEVYTPRMQLADADGDGLTDLLVTIATGDRRRLGSFRTRLLFFPGPFRDPETGALVASRTRIDTESVALHPVFVDLDRDGALDYVTDSVRGTTVDMLKRVLGQDPTIWYVAFRFDRATGTFEPAPFFRTERGYSREEAVGNRFGRTGFLDGDFDGDGRADLLDLGDLEAVEILRAAPAPGRGGGDKVHFPSSILSRQRVPGGLVADARIADFDGDGRSDAVVWNREAIFLLASGGGG